MRTEWDATKYKDSFLLDKGYHPMKIVEAVDTDKEGKTLRSKTGHPMVIAKCKCIDSKCSEADEVWHWVTVIPPEMKGAGMLIHWLKTIGQPYEGKIVLDTDKWLGKKFIGNVVHGEYNGKPKHEFKDVSPYRDMDTSIEEQPPVAETDDSGDDSIPF